MSPAPGESPTTPYPTVTAQADFPAMETDVLARWERDDTFRRSIEQRPAGDDGSNEFVFYDGPPFANGLPHYGHLLTAFVKDVVPRYQTMRGRRVERRFGWDCHGLPAEMEAERELGITGHVQIEEFGVGNFNAHCRTSVLKYTNDWQRYVTRAARWVDFDNDYKTMDLPYMESVLWTYKQLSDKGLIYEGHRVLPYCWECETPLSNAETRLDDAYRERQDPAITVWFQLETGERILVWTTTPWTLPSNLALAVGPDLEYAVLDEDGVRYIVGAGTLGSYEKELAGATRVDTVLGSELVGRSYTPMFPFFADHPNAFRVLGADFVDVSEGAGTVHLAPGFGEDDQMVCAAHDIAVVAPVDERGCYTSELGEWAGLQVFDANAVIIKALKERGQVVRHDTYLHSYPHCWRTDTPLIYKAVNAWFVRVTDVKERAIALNQEHIGWVPEQIRDGAFGSWLGNARDWCISRNRFWGTPIPVWRSDDPSYPREDVYGSLDEIERDFGVRLDDLHRPGIDALTRPNPDDPTGRSTMRRVEEVLDCWFESGSMPYAQVHYPFENRQWFEDHFPADFIVEYVGQSRAWFYFMHVLSTALFDRPPFKTAIAHGVLLGDDGRKLSKRLRNYPDPDEIFDTLGADAMRWALVSSPGLRAQDVVVERKAFVEVVRSVLNPLWSTWHFFTLYANADGRRATPRTDSTHVLDRYVLAKTQALVVEVTARMDALDLYGVCAAVVTYLDALTNWYVRRSRDRFWAGDADAYDTLAAVLEVLVRLLAPLLPLLTEQIWSGLTGGDDGRHDSVHLTDWPRPDELPADLDLVAAMDLARDACSSAHSIRKAQSLRSRLPLPSMTVAAPGADRMAPFADLLRDELNVKQLLLTTDVAAHADEVLAVTPAVLGPRLGADTQKVIKAAKAGDYEIRDDGTARVGGFDLAAGEFSLRLVPRDETAARAVEGRSGIVALDTAVTPALEAEGLARDIVRLVQVARRDEGLQVSDRIRLSLHAPDDALAAVEAHRAHVMEQTLAVELHNGVALADGHRGELPDGRAVTIAVVAIG